MPGWYSRPLKLKITPMTGPDVCTVQRIVGAYAHGYYDEVTAQRVRGWQRASGIDPTGEVDVETARVMG